jgi:hypothetical protein
VNCLECHPAATPAIAVCGRCGAGLCAAHLVESDEYLTFNMPINAPVRAARPARKLRCGRCAAAELAQQERRSA